MQQIWRPATKTKRSACNTATCQCQRSAKIHTRTVTTRTGVRSCWNPTAGQASIHLSSQQYLPPSSSWVPLSPSRAHRLAAFALRQGRSPAGDGSVAA